MAISVMQRTSRRTGTRRATSSVPSSQASGPIAQLIAQRAGMVARQEYTPIGRIMKIKTANGWIDFGHFGPSFGKLLDGNIDLLDAWPGVPASLKATEDLCPDCLAPCDECVDPAKKKQPRPLGYRVCSYGNNFQACGGTGRVKVGEKPCQCVKARGRFNPKCSICHATGKIDVMAKCPQCHGEGKVECRLCRGTCNMSTGRVIGKLNLAKLSPAEFRLFLRTAPTCPSCRGYARKLELTPQDLSPHLMRNAAAVAIGPILGLMAKPVEGAMLIPEWWEGSADAAGHPLTLVMTDLKPGVRATFLGGVLVQHKNSASA